MILSIDFDGTIVTEKYPKIGKLIPYAKQISKTLKEK